MRFLSMIRIDEKSGQQPSERLMNELTKRFLRIHGDEWDLECEVRPLDGPEFGCSR